MNDRVFVSPGVYTSENDLTFVSQNIGVTTLGLAGETLKGPAFQPIFISNYGEFKKFFGGKSPKKFKNSGFLKYELPYIANSYLENSNQLYVTRTLGLSGYDAGTAYGIMVDGVLVALLRSKATYDSEQALVFSASDITLGGTPELKDDLTLTVTLTGGGSETHTISLDPTKRNYITRKLGKSASDGKYAIYVDEIYPEYISTLPTTGEVALLYNDDTESTDFKTQYKAAYTPYIVSEVIDTNTGEVKRLFRFETISDGHAANDNIKVSIANIRPDQNTFDVIVRDINDTDSRNIILERYSACNMDPSSRDYIGRRIGTIDGDFEAISSYVLVDIVDEEDNIDSFPAGFEGYPVNSTFTIPTIPFKSTYTINDKVERTYLGFSDDFDKDLLKFKGVSVSGITKGFHMDSEASSDDFVVGSTTFRSELEVIDTDYERISSRKFTVLPYGGFDGWDVYREERTTGDSFTIQRVADGIFEDYVLTNGEAGNTSDYYAYLEAIQTFSNPKAVDINVFATPGIDLFNNPMLVDSTIDMIENDRSDSIYIVTTPDTSEKTKMTAQDVASRLYDSFDSNYTATYWPWIQKTDDENSANIYLPPTCEVVKNIALTDNLSFPWFSTAGFTFGNVQAIKPRVNITQPMNNTLYSNRINPLINYSGEGIKIMGNKNMQLADTPLNRLNVRRLLLRARKLISNVGVRLLFDQNDQTIRDAFLDQVNPILEEIRAERGLHNFRVEVDPVTEGQDRNTLYGRILLRPTDALEYISISFDVTNQGASFEDI